ncbi:MAG: N-acetylglucosamine-6-phosphate deacetylase [Halothermotrichaceae bacterium]
MKLIKNVNIIFNNNIKKGNILFNDQIIKVINNKKIKKYLDKDKVQIIDGRGCYLAPGFIDIHIHGASGYDTMNADYKSINEISKAVIQTGVTSFLPTTMSMPVNDIHAALVNIKNVIKQGTDGARVLGTHLEGPFLNKDYKGAQKENYIISPEINLIEDYIDIIKIVTIAPEIAGADKLIKYLHNNDIIVSLGHSGATYEQVITAKSRGLTHVTHLFNGMRGLHHREPGVVGAALNTDMSCELIADFIHINPEVLKIVFKIKELDKIILITDQMKAGLQGDGLYQLGGQKVIVKDGAARLKSGTLAGSVLTLDQAVKNIYSLDQLSLPDIINMVTLNPAWLLGLGSQLGQLKPGYKADMVLLDGQLNLKRVFKEGKEVI